MKVLLCRCSSGGVIPRDREGKILSSLRGSDISVIESNDLCALAAKRDSSLKELADDPNLRVIACQPRAVRWLFHMAGAPLTGKEDAVLDARSESASKILDALGVPEAPEAAQSGPVPESEDPSWFPSIDFSRCSHCDRCRDFCLFDVFGSTVLGEIFVKSPGNCKPNCPACARICPEGAILFPKSAEPTVNGAEIPKKAMTAEQATAEAEGIFGEGDLYHKLQGRSRKKRVSLLRQAYAERAACGCNCDGPCEPAPLGPESRSAPTPSICSCEEEGSGEGKRQGP